MSYQGTTSGMGFAVILLLLFCTAEAFRPADKGDLKIAVAEWLENPKSAESKYGQIALWDTSMVTDMSCLFQNEQHFNAPIGGWNTLSVTNMSHMFANARAFNQDIGNWSTTNVVDMSYMFYQAHKFNQDLSKWDTRRVTDMSNMFAEAWYFNRNISGWSVCSVRDMTDMFCCQFPFKAYFLYLTSLQSTWDMAPPACGKAVRRLTPSDVSSCLDPEGFGRLDSGASSRLPTIASPMPTGALGLVVCAVGLAVRYLRGGCQARHAPAPAEDVPSLTALANELLMENSYLTEEGIVSASERTTSSEAKARNPEDATSFETISGSRGRVELELLLGSGQFGKTWKALLVSDGDVRTREVVAKKLRPEYFSPRDVFMIYKEMVKIMMLPGDLPHPRLVGVIRQEAGRRLIVMELCDGNLEWFRTNEAGAVCVSQQVKLLEQAAAGCKWIVRQRCVHGNLKMQNILIKLIDKAAEGLSEPVAKVADFGLPIAKANARTWADRPHLAPETGAGEFSEKSDVYSFGYIMLQTFCPRMGRPRLREEDREKVTSSLRKEWKKTDPCVTEELCEAAVDCIYKSLAHCVKKRPSFASLGKILSNLRELVESCAWQQH